MPKSRVLIAGLLGLVLVSLIFLAAPQSRSTLGKDSQPPRPDTETVLYVDEAVKSDADRMLAAYPAPAGTTLKVERGGGDAAVEAVRSGTADLALTVVRPNAPDLTASPVLYRPQVLAAPWLSPVRDVPLAEARRLAAEAVSESGPGLLAGGPSAFTRNLQPVTVDGVLPSLSNIRQGLYPLSEPVYLVTRADGSPNAGAASLADWLRRPEASDAFLDAAPQATLAVFGDIMLARGVDGQIGKFGVDWPFEQVSDRTRASDITFANLESPFGTTGTPLPRKLVWFRARPEAAAALPKAGVDVVTLANNHILDYDTPNFLETLDLLDKAGVKHVGGGRTLTEARQPVIMEVNGIRVAFLGYSGFADIFWDYKYPRRFTATDDTPGKPAVPGVAPIRLDLIQEDIAAARKQADIVAVAYHWGWEYTNVPGSDMVALAHASVDAGADLVLGFHPHAVQGFEQYKNGFIAYSLGNFVMDQKRDITRESMILEFLLQKDGVRAINVVPVMIQDYRPHLAQGQEAADLWAKLRRISGLIPAPAGMVDANGPKPLAPTSGPATPAPKPAAPAAPPAAAPAEPATRVPATPATATP